MTADKPAILGGVPLFPVNVPFARPNLPSYPELAAELSTVISSGRMTNGDQVTRFESAAAEYLKVHQCVAVNSGASGLILTLRALNVKGEVILPSFTFFATAHAVLWNNLRPVFVDCEPDTFNISPAEVQRAITERTGAVIGVHVHGNPAAVEDLQVIAENHRVPLVLDSAQAFGSQCNGRPIGSFGTAECFSLSPIKTVTSAEGGLVATNDASLAQLLRSARNYGDSGNYDPDLVGLSARMSELHATVGLHSLKQLESEVKRRNDVARLYQDRLSKIDGLSFQKVRVGNRATYSSFPIVVDRSCGLSPAVLCKALEREGIPTRRYFHPPVHRQKQYLAYSEATRRELTNTDKISDSVVCLPIYSRLRDADVSTICSALERIYVFRRELAGADL